MRLAAHRPLAAASFVVLAIAALPAAADWLVLRDGTRVETRGAWTEKGRRLVVFTDKDGRLASLRADIVDLGASRLATAEAARAADEEEAATTAPAPAEPSRAVRRITNADIPAGSSPVAGGGGRAAAGEAPRGGEAVGEPAAPGDLQVRDAAQEMDPIDGHLIVRGRLANTAQRTAAAVEVVVHAFGPEGVELGSLPADLGVEALIPGASTPFEAHFHDVFTGAFGLSFTPAATYLESRPPDDAPERGEPEGEGAGPQL
ncbi:MAG TPA: hypothetical protein VF100_13625 [Thermoanaerobaculia bacterium]